MMKQTRYGNVMRYDVRSPQEHQEDYRRDQTSTATEKALYYLLDTSTELQRQARPMILGDSSSPLAKLVGAYITKLGEQRKALEELGLGDSEQHEALRQEIEQAHSDYRAALKKLAGPNFKIAGFSSEIFNVNEALNIADYHSKFVAELTEINRSLGELVGQYDADFHRQFFILADLLRFISGQLILARVSNSYKQLRRIRIEVQAELAAFQYLLREIEFPAMPAEDQTGKIPPASLGVDFARGWMIREIQYVRGSIAMTGTSMKHRLGIEEYTALNEAIRWFERIENRLLGVDTHAELQEQFELMLERQLELSRVIFPEQHQKPA